MDISCCIILASVEVLGDSILAISEVRKELLFSSFCCSDVSSRGVAKISTNGSRKDESSGLAVNKYPQEYL